ncbi:hypothetical protein CWIS_15890 [Cellulomonas sp. A375-1]|uniref:hypothetical protein n=1 Tax=Cellulomonas sp. A375-1 TaxID=1672219 RepID=UPI0006528248|nr:hypothetical protein [Cellulomonas sp. A375-1]KMM44527.1 hypothetical protein CWIS_15890 [Cellulomonas sp. A375-1]
MKRNVLAGLVLAVLTTVVVGLSLLGADVAPVVLLGAALGGVLGLVPGGSVAARVAGFLAGAALAWVGYLLRAAALPDSTAGRAVAVLIVLALTVGVVAVARGRVPLGTLLLGVAAVAGAYERVYAQDPTSVVSTSIATISGVLLAAAVGLLATVFLGPAEAAAPVAEASEDATTPAHGLPLAAAVHTEPRRPAAQPVLQEPRTFSPESAAHRPSLALDPRPEA